MTFELATIPTGRSSHHLFHNASILFCIHTVLKTRYLMSPVLYFIYSYTVQVLYVFSYLFIY